MAGLRNPFTAAGGPGRHRLRQRRAVLRPPPDGRAADRPRLSRPRSSARRRAAALPVPASTHTCGTAPPRRTTPRGRPAGARPAATPAPGRHRRSGAPRRSHRLHRLHRLHRPAHRPDRVRPDWTRRRTPPRSSTRSSPSGSGCGPAKGPPLRRALWRPAPRDPAEPVRPAVPGPRAEPAGDPLAGSGTGYPAQAPQAPAEPVQAAAAASTPAPPTAPEAGPGSPDPAGRAAGRRRRSAARPGPPHRTRNPRSP